MSALFALRAASRSSSRAPSCIVRPASHWSRLMILCWSAAISVGVPRPLSRQALSNQLREIADNDPPLDYGSSNTRLGRDRAPYRHCGQSFA